MDPRRPGRAQSEFDRHRHARTARLANLFVGSTTEGVLCAKEIPVLVVRADHKPAEGKRIGT